jgi:hypothetical protein
MKDTTQGLRRLLDATDGAFVPTPIDFLEAPPDTPEADEPTSKPRVFANIPGKRSALRLILTDGDGEVVDSWTVDDDEDVFAHLMDAEISEVAKNAIDVVLSERLR